MTGRIPRITNAQIEADTQTIRALKGIPDYKPHNPEFSAEAAEAAVGLKKKSERNRPKRNLPKQGE